MPRREIVTIEDVQRRRATSWEMHYRNRQAVRQLAAQPLIKPNEPTYHPVSFQPKDLEGFLNKES